MEEATESIFMILKQLKILRYFLSHEYWRAIQDTCLAIPGKTIQAILDYGKPYFPEHGVELYATSMANLKTKFQGNRPFAMHEKELPRDLLGVFIPGNQERKSTVVVNSHPVHQGMQLANFAHEVGHLVVDLYRVAIGEALDSTPRPIQARVEDLKVCVHDPEELMADLLATLGCYPRKFFLKIFCNAAGAVHWIYKKSPFLLFLRGLLFIGKTCPELTRHFIFSRNKLFHLCVTIHFVRMRVLAYENYGL